MRRLRILARWARARRAGGPVPQVWRAADEPRGKCCKEPGCGLPAEVYDAFTLMGWGGTKENLTRESVLFAKVRCVGGHHYIEDTGMAAPYGGEELY